MVDMPEHLRAKMNAPPGPPIAEARKFLRSYWGDEGETAAVRDDMARTIALSPRDVIRGLQASEALLRDPPPPGTLVDMVLWDANHPMSSGTDEAARAWLSEQAEMVREVLGVHAPPRQ